MYFDRKKKRRRKRKEGTHSLMVMMMKEVREKPEKRYGICSKVSNTKILLFLFSNKMLVIILEFSKHFSVTQTGKTLIRLLLKKQSDLVLHCLSRTF